MCGRINKINQSEKRGRGECVTFSASIRLACKGCCCLYTGIGSFPKQAGSLMISVTLIKIIVKLVGQSYIIVIP